MTFGQLLKSRREGRGIALADLATRAGLDVSLVERMEQDALEPTLPAIEKLAWALGEDVRAFLPTAVVTIEGDTSPGLAVSGSTVTPLSAIPRAADAEVAKQEGGDNLPPEERGIRRLAGRLQTVLQDEFTRRGQGVLAAVATQVAAGQHEAALNALVGGMKDAFGRLASGPRLLEESTKIDAARLPSDAVRKQLYESRVKLADQCGRYDVAVDDARKLLQDHGPTLSPEYRHGLQLVVANGLSHLNRREAAAAEYAALLSDATVGAGAKAWAYRGLAILNGYGSDVGVENERRAIDNFLVAGEYLEAAIGTARLADACRLKDPEGAIALLERAIGWLPGDAAHTDVVASFRHTKGAALLKAGKAEDGLRAALQAADLRRDIIGREAEYVSSLWLARFCAAAMGNTNEVERIRGLIEAAVPTVRAPDALLRQRMMHLVDGGTGETPEAILREAEAAGDSDSLPLLRGLVALTATDLPYARRLEELDLARQAARVRPRRAGDAAIEQLLSASAGRIHLNAGQDEPALQSFRAALAIDPFDAMSRQGLAAILLRNQRWAEAAEFFRAEHRLAGDVPGLLLHLGESLLRSGQPGEAIPVLHRAKKNATAGAAYLPEIEQLLQEALDALEGGPVPTPSAAPSPLVSIQDFEAALDAFGRYIRDEKRMLFWRLEARKHKWAEKPEALGENLLVSFIRGRFGDSVEASQQVWTGAGRIDVFFRFQGGLRVIVEIKLCGEPYTENYAKDGLDQLVHYMESKDTGLGYLVVFDGRVRHYGRGFPARETVGQHVVVIRAVDVRPEIPSVRTK